MRASDARMDRDLLMAYRNTFRSKSGRIVFAHMMGEAGYFSPEPLSDELNTLRAFMNRILFRMGALPSDEDGCERAVEEIFKGLTNIPVKGDE